MKKEEKKVPQLRFPKFAGDWEQRKLGEITTEKLSNGIMNHPSEEMTGVKHINVINMYTSDRIHIEDLTDSEYDDDAVKKCNVEIGDIFLTRSSVKPEGIAEANVLLDSGQYVYDDHLIRMKIDKCKYDAFFVKICLGTPLIKKQFIMKSKTTAFTTIGQDDIASCDCVFPSYGEQKAIGAFFDYLDHLITLHQRKLEKIKEFKKGVMQKLFSQEVRFKADDESEFPEWEEKTFHEVIKLYRGSSPRPIVEYIVDDNQGLNWIKISDVPQNGNVITTVKEHISKEGAEKSRAVYKGEIILSNSMSFGKPCILGIDGFIHDGWFVIREYEKYLNKWYLCQLLNSDIMYKQYRRLAAGGVVLNISSEIVNSTKIPVPCLAEQQKIADCLSSLDEVIEKQKAALAAWKELKKGLLQQMFV